MYPRIVRLKLQRLMKLGDRFGSFPPPRQCQPEVVTRPDQAGLEPQCLIEFGLRRGDVPLSLQAGAKVVVGFGIVGPHLDGAAVLGLGFGGLEALVEAAGGFAQSPKGSPLGFNRRSPRIVGLIAGGQDLRDELVRFLAQA